MRLGILQFAIVTALLVVAGSTSSRADNCSGSPSYSPDFSTNQSCLTLNSASTNPGYPGFYPPVSGTGAVLRLTPNAFFTSGSAWFTTPQSVSGAFSTTFTFQLSGTSSSGDGNADGFAFVIQNSALAALGPDGCGLGYGDSNTGCAPTTGGIPYSLAIEFDTYQNADDPNNNHVAIQSCGGATPNSIDHVSGGVSLPCNLALNSAPGVTLADGNPHTVTVTYSGPSTTLLDVLLDGHDLFPGGVNVNLNTLLTLTTGTAWVGFTAATGGGDDNQDILSWTFTPQSQSGTVTTGSTTVLQFQNDVYDYTAQLNSGSPTTATVTPILMTPAACDALVQETYPGAHCFVYGNLSPNPDSAVLLELTCPNLPSGQCNPFDAQVGTNFDLSTEAGVNLFNPLDPFPGWLKGDGGVAGHPCTPPAPPAKLFQSNQVDLFSITRIDPVTKGHSGGTGSCWAATYAQPDEVAPGITITSPTSTSYAQGQTVTASYTCSNPTTSKLPETSSPVGPYLTAASCTQATGTGSCSPTAGGLACTGTVDTSTVGPHTFEVTALDSGTNTSTQSVNYTVVGPTNLQILNLALPGTAPTGSKITYNIGVAAFGPANAVGVTVTDLLPSNTEFLKASGTNVDCSFVNNKFRCSSSPVVCSLSGSTVSCSVGTLVPLTLSSLNGATISITVKVTGAPTTSCPKSAQFCTFDTATVSAINTDTNSTPSSTAQTVW